LYRYDYSGLKIFWQIRYEGGKLGNYENIEYISFVHTLSFKTYDIVYKKNEQPIKPTYIKSITRHPECTTYIVNPNKYRGVIHCVEDFKNVMHDILDDLGISTIYISRIDFCLNTNVNYDELFKINHTFKELYSFAIGSKNSYYTLGDDHKKRSTKVDHHTSSLEIYNKEIESEGKSPYKTRMEFRFYHRMHLDGIDKLVKHIQDIFCKLPSCFDKLVDQQLIYLCNAYEREKQEKSEGRILSLSEFVAKYSFSFFTYDVARRFYNQYQNGQFKSWLYQYRKNGHVLSLYSKKDMINYIKILQRSVKKYVNP